MSISQNLIVNPSFEDRECKSTNDLPTRYMERSLNWSEHEFVQFFSVNGFCPNADLLDTLLPRIPSPISGSTFGHYFIGFPAFVERLAHGNIRNELVEPLEKDKKYFFRMYRMLAPWSEFTVSQWEVVLFQSHSDWLQARDDIRDHPNVFYHSIIPPDTNFIETFPQNWEKYETCFVAQGGESILSFLYILPGENISSLVKRNPHYEIQPGFGQSKATRNSFAIFMEDVQIEAVPDEVTVLVEFCDNDYVRKLDNSNFNVPDMVTMAGSTYLWQDGNQELYRSMAGINFATLTVNMPCATFPVNVRVTEKECLVHEGVYIPQAFSPNKDGINDVFKPLGRLFDIFRFTIYDRFGGELYSGSGPDSEWDGTSRGYEVQPGVYTWILEYKAENSEPKLISGEVLLKR